MLKGPYTWSQKYFVSVLATNPPEFNHSSRQGASRRALRSLETRTAALQQQLVEGVYVRVPGDQYGAAGSRVAPRAAFLGQNQMFFIKTRIKNWNLVML